jgi:hypothetical protein
VGTFRFTLDRSDAIYIAQHLRPMDRVEADATSAPNTSDEDRGTNLAANPGRHFTVWASDGDPVAMGGWVPLWLGVASAWMLATPRIAEIGVALDRALLAGAKLQFEEGYHRLQAFGLERRIDARVWMMSLGYKLEGIHPMFGRHGETFASYAKLRG